MGDWMNESERIKQTHIITDADNSVVLFIRKRGRIGGGQSGGNGDRKRLFLGHWVHNAVCKQCFVELYT